MLWGMRRFGLALAMALVALIAAAPAGAAEAWVSGQRLFYVAGPGETNDLEISQGSGGTTIVDNGASIDPGAGCTALSANEVSCAASLPLAWLRDGNDTSVVASGLARVFGGPGDEELSLCASCPGWLYGSEGNDHLVSGDTRGTLDGGAGDDVLDGGGGNQWIAGRTGNDLITGGAGADLITPGPGTDGVDGGDNRDTLRYSQARGPVIVDLKNGYALGEGPDQFDNVEGIVGSRFGDDLRGDSMANRILGRDGADVLRGRGYPDDLFAGAGNDIIYAREGHPDEISGGPGFDRAHVDGGLHPDRVQRVERLF
jgi:Ca2+-binding RTX toxin-like protein